MVAAGCARKLIFSWLGNPGVGSLHAIRRAIESDALEIEEYSHFGMVGRYVAGAAHLPFYPLRSYAGSDLPAANLLIQWVASPYTPMTRSQSSRPQPGRDDHPRPARRRQRERPGLGPGRGSARGGARRRARDRRGRGAGGRGRHPFRSGPDPAPGVAVTAVCVEPFGAHRPSPRATTTGTTRSTVTGTRSPRPGRRTRGSTSGSAASRIGRLPRQAGPQRPRWPASRAAASGSVDYGEYA